jgi:hypothetical protein
MLILLTRGTICITEYDAMHQIWIHIRSSVTLDVFVCYCLMMVL